MEKEYVLTKESIQIKDRTLYRIQALIDFGDVKTGDIGGFIESEANLSHSNLRYMAPPWYVVTPR